MRVLDGLAAVCVALLTASEAGIAQSTALPPDTSPLALARLLASKYPAQPIMSYIPALAWSGSIRLTALTKEPQWREKAAKDMQALLSDHTPAIAEPYRLTSLAGALAFADAATIDGDKAAATLASKVAAFMLPQSADETIRFATGWTDDMFMASSVLSRVDEGVHAAAVGKLLTSYADKLQRADGLFVHATNGPHAWGRGNGFALLGVTEALTHLPGSWPDRPRVLEIYRRHVKALATHQSDDGSWRQVVDEPASYRELTVTAMTVAALARGLSRGWLDHPTFDPILNRGWAAVVARVNSDGTVKDVCSGTGVGPTKQYYLARPVVNGADDRDGAMALLAAIEMESMRRAPR
jgi:unsaturated rhamnogalacturonyl hydrolase